MNNDVFKKFIDKHTETALASLGGLAKVREMHTQMPMTPFVAGYVVGAICTNARDSVVRAKWRDDPTSVLVAMTQEEIRRVFDYVRVRLETESTTS